jgi:hypothetical protein
MSQNQSEPPPQDPAAGADSGRDLTNQQLAEQARAAADQALQLARLAEESARLARHLNEQVALRAGHAVPHPVDVAPAPAFSAAAASVDEESPPVLVHAEERWRTLARGRRRRRCSRTSPPTLSQPSTFDQNGHQLRFDHPLPVVREDGPSSRRAARNRHGLLLSTLLHLMLLVGLGLLTMALRPEPQIDTILASFVEEEPPPVEVEEVQLDQPAEEVGEQLEEPLPPAVEEPPPPPAAAEQPQPEPVKLEPPAQQPPDGPMPPQPPVAMAAAPAAVMPAAEAADAAAIDLTAVGSRSAEGKAFLLKKYGGTPASEAAVSRALAWFASIQRRDGSWNFDDVGQASHAGTADNPMGATSYVLLAFLGAGQTHREGEHKTNVAQGLNFLIRHARSVPAGVDLRGPNVEEHHNFYVQGAAATALCEAFTMTKDRRLRVPAQRAIDFIVNAQDPHGGGWRYEPREAGCTSVSTLQLMALISAQNAGWKIPPQTLEQISHFYDTVQCDGGPTGRYCYRAAERSYKSASTAQAALGRMYLGATRDDEDLQAAVALLDARGPYDNRYYCYYATQVLKNWGGDEWDRWNQSMRDELIRTQIADEGPARGSWTPLQRGPTDLAGGRLFTTALSTMTLEVYYRHLPLYETFDGEADQAADAKVAEGGKPAEE